MSGIIFGGATIDLTAPPTNIGTTTPPAITVSTLFRSANTGNAAFVAQPSGTGAFQLQQADNTATGGNARGANAVDLQTVRGGATQVASGASSAALGQSNTVTGGFSFAAGNNNTVTGSSSAALGQGNTVTGGFSFATGNSNTASGLYSIALGVLSNTRGVAALFALGNSIDNTPSKSQTTILGIGTITTNATPKVLTSDVNSATEGNQLALRNNSSITFAGLITATTVAAGDGSSWKFEGMIQRGANAAATALVAAVTPTLIAQKAGASGWVVAVTADTIYGCLAVTVTGQAATTIRWECSIFASEVAF